MTNDGLLQRALAVREALEIEGNKLVVYAFSGWDFLIESYELAAFLGYTQHSSLRKQTLTDWKGKFVSGIHYVMTHDEETIRNYEELYRQVHGYAVKPMKSSRGRLFFLPQGLGQLLKKSTKPTAHVVAALENRGIDLKMDAPLSPNEESTPLPDAPTPAVEEAPAKSLEDRKFEYGVMQELIKQLERLQQPQLRSLAITAAETALGRRLDEVRTGEVLNNVFTATASTPRRAPTKPTLEVTTTTTHPARVVVDGPIFTKNDFHSMTRIGEKAGGYSAKQAGQAADIVAERFGYTREQIRNKELPINQLAMRPDTTTGRKRQMVRFHTKFANQVVLELRQNPQFMPEAAPTGIPTFESNEGYPTLSRGPLEEQTT